MRVVLLFACVVSVLCACGERREPDALPDAALEGPDAAEPVDAGEPADASESAADAASPCASCTGATPVCDPATETCKTCTLAAGCPAKLLCDTRTGAGRCVACLSSLDCRDAANPVCDPSTNTCAPCTAAEGCSVSKVCDTAATPRACVGCLATADCARGVCDPALKACVTCTATEGCDPGQRCDLSVNGGLCTGCGVDAHCPAATPVCDTARNTCVVCTAAKGCAAGQVCDTSVSGGVCRGCLTGSTCPPATPVCDGATWTCVTCTSTAGCANGQRCKTSGAPQCVDCLADADCKDAAKPFCSPATNRCVQCTGDANCPSSAPICEQSQCVFCSSGAGCAGGQTCDPVGQQCLTCTATSGCSGATPKCLTSYPGGRCVECLDASDCAGATGKPVCGASNTCEPDPVVVTTQEIQQVRASVPGTNLALPITAALVTHLKPALAEYAGFFIQSQQPGPAVFVGVDPATLSPPPAIGDRVSFTVETVQRNNVGVVEVQRLSGFRRVSAGNAVAPLEQDVSAATDLVTWWTNYESELLTLAGTLTGPTAVEYNSYVGQQLQTAGAQSGLKLRYPQALLGSKNIEAGCELELHNAVMWRYSGTVEVMVQNLGDMTVKRCAAPVPSGAAAPNPTSVEISFDRELDPASVVGSGAQFTFTNGLLAQAAAAQGKKVVVTTSPQTPGASYSVSIANTVKDPFGQSVNAPQPLAFTASKQPAQVVFNEINMNIGAKGLVELRVTAAGTLDGITVTKAQSLGFLAYGKLPNVPVQAGDLVVVHYGDTTFTNETTMTSCTVAACYPNAWDFRGDYNPGNSGTVWRLYWPDGASYDAVPFTGPVNDGVLPQYLRQIQAAGLWLPADCGGTPCDTVAKAAAVSVDWTNAGTTVSSNSVWLKSGTPGTSKADWTVGPASWGAPNP